MNDLGSEERPETPVLGSTARSLGGPGEIRPSGGISVGSEEGKLWPGALDRWWMKAGPFESGLLLLGGPLVVAAVVGLVLWMFS